MVLLVVPILLLLGYPLIILHGHIYFRCLVSPIVKLSLSVCLYFSEVSCILWILPILHSPLFEYLSITGHACHPFLLFFHFLFQYYLTQGPKYPFYIL